MTEHKLLLPHPIVESHAVDNSNYKPSKMTYFCYGCETEFSESNAAFKHECANVPRIVPIREGE